MAQVDGGSGGDSSIQPPDPVQPDPNAQTAPDPLADVHAKLDEIKAMLAAATDPQANSDDASDRRGPGMAAPPQSQADSAGPLDARDGGTMPPPTPVPPPGPPPPGGLPSLYPAPPTYGGPPVDPSGRPYGYTGAWPPAGPLPPGYVPTTQGGPLDARDAGVLPPRPGVPAGAAPTGAGAPAGTAPAPASNALGGFNPANPADAQWYQDFAAAHQGMPPDVYYAQPNNAKPGMTPMQAAMADRGWGNQMAAGRAAAYGAGGNAIVTHGDWQQHYAAGGPTHTFVPFAQSQVSQYAGNLRGGGGGGGRAPSTGGAPSWWTQEVEAAWQDALKKH